MTYTKETTYESEIVLFLRVPIDLKEKVKRLAKENNMSVNHYMTGLINSLSEKEMALIRKLEINKIYDEDLKVVGTVDKLNEATKAAVPSATDPGGTY